MNVLLPIVGVRHHHPDDTAHWIASLPSETEVLLLPEPSNTFDRMAVQAYINQQLVGYLSADFLDIFHLNYPNGQPVQTHLVHHPYLDEETSFFIEIPLSTPDFPAYEMQIDTSPIAELSIPRFFTQEELLLVRLMNECMAWISKAEAEDCEMEPEDLFRCLLTFVEQFRPLFGHSLSGDHLRLYRQLYILLEASLDANLSGDLLCELFDALQLLLDIRSDYASSREKCEQLFLNEREKVQEEADSFLTDYHRLISSGACSADELLHELDNRLRALPNHLYSLLDEPDLFAYRLLYMRLSSVELHTIMMLLICRDTILRSQPSPEQSAKLRIKDFPYWDGPTAHEKMQAYQTLSEAAQQKYAPSSLAKAVRRLQKVRILREDVSHQDLGIAINTLLETHINPDSFKRDMNRKRSKE